MARYEGAVWRPITEELERTEPAIRPTQIIWHETAVLTRSLFDWWESDGSRGMECHFFISRAGVVEQYMDTERSADANLEANRRPDGTGAISVELEGLDPQFSNDRSLTECTPEQLREMVRLARWAGMTHGIPYRLCRTPEDPGHGWHVMWGSPGAWTPATGKSCPGEHRVEQIKTVLLPALTSELGYRSLEEGASGPDVAELQKLLNRVGVFNLLPDGNFGAVTDDAVRIFQRVHDLTVDGGVGPQTLGALADPPQVRFYTRVAVGGVTLNERTRRMVVMAERFAGRPFLLMQGSYNRGGVDASAGTHDGGGVFDARCKNLTNARQDEDVRAMRRAGFCAWERFSPPFRAAHYHAVAAGDRELSDGAVDQVRDYLDGRDGLARNGADPGPKVPSVKLGSTGAEVEHLQRRLGLVDDGDFGPVTDANVRAVQTKLGLRADGVVGIFTRAALAATGR